MGREVMDPSARHLVQGERRSGSVVLDPSARHASLWARARGCRA